MPEVIVVQGNLARQEELKCRVGAYARVSSDSDDQLNSFFNQVQHYTKLIKSNPEWEYVDIYADEGVTGTRADKRSDFNRMIKECEDGKLDKIITKSISRFARNAVDCVKILKHLKNFGVSVIFEEDHLDSSNPSDFTMICAKASLAEEQSKSTAENVRMGNRYRMQEGTYVQSNPPIGFTLKDKELVINEEQAPVIKRIFDSYLAGKSTSRIAEELMRDRIPNKYGKVHWTSAGISYIISNVRYKGDAILQKSFKTGFPYKQVPNNGELPKFYVHNDNEPIVDESTYDKANALLQARQEKHAHSSVSKNSIFARKIYCKECKTPYRHKSDTDNWVCRTHDKNSDKCQATPISEEMVKKAFVQMYNKLKANYERILLPFITQAESIKVNKAEKEHIEELNIKIAQITEQVLTLRNLNGKGAIDPAFYISELNRHDNEVMKLRAIKSEILHNSQYDDIISKTRMLASEMETEKALDVDKINSLVSEITGASEGNPRKLLTILTYLKDNGFLSSNKIITLPGIVDEYGNPLKSDDARFKNIKTELACANDKVMKYFSAHPEAMHKMSANEFEYFIASILDKLGYKTTVTPPTNDGGVDIYAAKKDNLGSFLFLIQCKNNKPQNPVGISIIRELYGVLNQKNATLASVFTTSYFSKPAIEFQKQFEHQLSLHDYNDIKNLLKELYRQ